MEEEAKTLKILKTQEIQKIADINVEEYGLEMLKAGTNLDKYTEFIFKNKNDVYKFKNNFNEKRILFLNYKFNVTFDDKPYPDVEVSHYLWTHGYSKTAIIDTYRKTDPDYATLRFVVKKKQKNN